VDLVDGKTMKGPIAELEDLPLTLGAETIKANPTKALELVVTQPKPDHSVEFKIVVRDGGQEIARVRDALRFRDAPGVKEDAIAIDPDPEKEAKKLDGFWVLDHVESRGILTWPQHPEEAIYIESNKVLWVRKNGKIPPKCPEATIEVDVRKVPQRIDFTIRSGPTAGQVWKAIYKVEGNRLTIATDCNEDICPTLFITRPAEGSAQFLRTYRRVTE
jgi:uncharacterized protein (TIGR03067 family)